MEYEKLTDDESKQKEVARVIREAFAGVTLGDGVGLWWGQVLDSYRLPDSVADYHANHERNEERQDWSRIPADDLYLCYSSLSFFDAKGIRFHLPAFMLLELSDRCGWVVYSLMGVVRSKDIDAKLAEYNREQCSLLDQKQRMAVRSFLLYCKDHPEYQFHVPDIECALNKYWVEDTPIPIPKQSQSCQSC